MLSLEKCLVPSCNSPHPGLCTQVSNTTAAVGVLVLGVALYGSSKVILEKHLKLDLGVLIGAIFSTISVLQIIIPEMTNFKHNKLFI